jgi:hypothetical protein
MPRCKNCKEKYEQYEFNNKFCKEIDCQTAKALFKLSKIKTQKKKDWKQKKKELKEKLKTNSDYTKEVQTVFNQWVRLRDKGLPCISCQKPSKKENAGHYRSVGSSPHLRFEPMNCHLQCEYCNTYLHGNLINYRVNLINKIGVEAVEKLEQNQESKKYSIPELIELKQVYKEKIRVLTLQNLGKL